MTFKFLLVPLICMSASVHATTLVFDTSGNIIGSVGSSVFGDAVIHRDPVTKVGATVASGVQQSLVSRGFSVSDPRVSQTINAISARTSLTSAAIGAGATALALTGRLLPIISVGVLVSEGVSWWFDNQGKVYLAPPGSLSSGPVFSSGISKGQLAWTVTSGYWGSPQEALSYGFSQTISQYPRASYGVPTLTQNSATQYTAQYNYSIPELSLLNMSASKQVTAVVWNGITCPSGSGFVSGTSCTSAGLSSGPWSSSPVQSLTLQQAYDALTPASKGSPLSKELASETANRLWKDAASQPGYSGIPWSSNSPVTPSNFSPFSQQYPEAWPTVSDWGSRSMTGTDPVSLPDTQAVPSPIPAASGSMPVNLGSDPLIPAPVIPDPPSNLFKPISDLMAPWLSFQVPQHDGVTCPTWNFHFSMYGYPYDLRFDSHCSLIEENRSFIASFMSFVWLIAGALILLSA